MSRWIIGDVHGCVASLSALLERLDSSASVFSVGDLVNRGPDSVGALRCFRERGGQTVLGNHEIYLLARAAGLPPKAGDTLAELLSDREAIEWVRHQPLLMELDELVVVHAGLAPKWSLTDAKAAAHRVESALQSAGWREAVLGLFYDRANSAIAADLQWLTRVRMVDAEGRFAGFKGPPAQAPDGLVHWADASVAVGDGLRVVYGHWAAQGLRRRHGTVGLDSGCVWGHALTAWCPDDDRMEQVVVEKLDVTNH